mmetsp:Transcript_31043/g.97251  ORF Transcript_31043/g.97251 Transcript_31043/m.97251 type:complete len:314 (-) Transcript_31043:135-1076(-)
MHVHRLLGDLEEVADRPPQHPNLRPRRLRRLLRHRARRRHRRVLPVDRRRRRRRRPDGERVVGRRLAVPLDLEAGGEEGAAAGLRAVRVVRAGGQARRHHLPRHWVHRLAAGVLCEAHRLAILDGAGGLWHWCEVGARVATHLRVRQLSRLKRRLAARRLAAAGVAKPDRRRRRQRLRARAPPLRRRRPDALATGVVARAREGAAGAEERVAQRRVVGAVVDPCRLCTPPILGRLRGQLLGDVRAMLRAAGAGRVEVVNCQLVPRCLVPAGRVLVRGRDLRCAKYGLGHCWRRRRRRRRRRRQRRGRQWRRRQ